MAAASSAANVSDITLCPICIEDFDNPRSLPCLHTFCLKCLEKYCKDKYPEDEVSCPVCREEFQIPGKGVEGLRHNFFIQGLLDAKLASPLSQSLTCSVEASGAAAVSEIEPQPRDSYCEKHKEKVVEMYCLDCKVNACALCLHYEHQKHECREICEAVETLIGQIDVDRERISTRIDAVRQEEKQIEKEKNNFPGELKKAEEAIKQRGEEIKRLVDSQISELLKEVQSLGASTSKETEARVERLQLALVALESFNAYSLEVKNKGKPSDITRAANELHDRADELLQTYVTSGDYRAPYVEFTPADLRSATQCESNMIGRLTTKTIPDMRLIRTLLDTAPIYGVTQLHDELYVLRSKQVEVYDVNSVSLKRHLSVTGLRDPQDLAPCEQNRCLYVADGRAKCVHRLDPLQGDFTRWSVYDVPYTLSITAAFDVLVTCREVRKLKEFSTHGDLVRQINLQPDVIRPLHSVQLANGQFVVSHGYYTSDPLHRVCTVDSNGRILQTYGGQRGSAAGQLSEPMYLFVDSDQFVFVADASNERVVLLSPELKYVRDVVSRVNGLEGLPRRIFLHKHQRRLYVADNQSGWFRSVGRLMVFGL